MNDILKNKIIEQLIASNQHLTNQLDKLKHEMALDESELRADLKYYKDCNKNLGQKCAVLTRKIRTLSKRKKPE